MNAYDLCAIPAAMFPQVECLSAGGLRLTYAEIDSWTAQLAASLEHRAAGCVAVCDVNTPGLVALALAAWRAGRAVVPLNVRARGDELAYLLDACRPAVVYAGTRYADPVQAVAPPGCPVEPVPTTPSYGETSGQIAADLDEDAVALGLYTSGSTARPKLVELTHGNLFAYTTSITELPSKGHGARPSSPHRSSTSPVSGASAPGSSVVAGWCCSRSSTRRHGSMRWNANRRPTPFWFRRCCAGSSIHLDGRRSGWGRW